MKDLSIDDIKLLLKFLTEDQVKIYLFKFLHDLHMFFGNQECCSLSDYQNFIDLQENCCEKDPDDKDMPPDDSAKNNTTQQSIISNLNYNDTKELKIDELQQKFIGTLSEQFYSQIDILRKSCNYFGGIQKKLTVILNEKENKDILELITLLEFMNPSFSLDLLTLIVICSTIQEDHQQCKKLDKMDIFKLLR